MNYSKWIHHFQRNKLNRPEPRWDIPVSLDKVVIKALLPSLEQFQLGDGGGPASLIAYNASQYMEKSEETKALVHSWFEEEKEHSRLLGEAVKRFQGRKIRGHWSFSAFCLCRKILGVRFELQVLLLTEIVSTAYYRLMKRHVQDAPVKEMCQLILRDESGHIHFHQDRLKTASATNVFIGSLFWNIQFWICGHGAATVLWTSHSKALRALGGTRQEYFREVRLELAKFVWRLNGSIATREVFNRTAVLPWSKARSTEVIP